MSLDNFIDSPQYQVFQDETLRIEVCRAVESVLTNGEAIKRNQLHSIPVVIQAAGLAGLREVAKKQKEKNTFSSNKAFWSEVDDIISATTTSKISLFNTLESKLFDLGVIKQYENIQDKREQRAVRKKNKELIEILMDSILSVYFEHFTCHYFYKTAQKGGSA